MATAGPLRPDAAARAQVLFDCWVEQAEENLQRDDIKACREGFETSVAAVESALAAAPTAVPTEPGSYLVFFDLNSAKLTPEAQDVTANAVKSAKERADEPIIDHRLHRHHRYAAAQPASVEAARRGGGGRHGRKRRGCRPDHHRWSR